MSVLKILKPSFPRLAKALNVIAVNVVPFCL